MVGYFDPSLGLSPWSARRMIIITRIFVIVEQLEILTNSKSFRPGYIRILPRRILVPRSANSRPVRRVYFPRARRRRRLHRFNSSTMLFLLSPIRRVRPLSPFSLVSFVVARGILSAVAEELTARRPGRNILGNLTQMLFFFRAPRHFNETVSP